MGIIKFRRIILSVLFVFITLINCHVFAATISGTIKDNSGNPITSDNIGVNLITISSSDPCSGWSSNSSVSKNPDGTYTFTNVSDGTYYLKVYNSGNTNYVEEWWNSNGGDWQCSKAQSVTVSGQNITGKDFNLELGGSISGTVYQSNGTSPLTESVYIAVIYGTPCESYNWYKGQSNSSSDGTYIIRGIPHGNFYLKSDNQHKNYVNEWWGSNGSTRSCSSAEVIAVSAQDISNKNFQLDIGGTITGTVYDERGKIITDDSLNVFVYSSSCDDRQYLGSNSINSSDGTYTLTGIPEGYVYLQTQNNGAPYADEWWTNSNSVYPCKQAESINISAGNTYSGRNFQLGPGSNLSGRVISGVDGTPQSNIEIDCWNESTETGNQTTTDSQGVFSFSNLPPGSTGIDIKPNFDSGFVHAERKYWLGKQQDKNIGIIKLKQGAKVYGFIKNASGSGIVDLEIESGGKMGDRGEATTYNDNGGSNDGYFQIRLPVGDSIINLRDEHNNTYVIIPNKVSVSDLNDVNLGNITAYDNNTGGKISGQINTNGLPYDGFVVGVFKNGLQISPEIFEGNPGVKMVDTFDSQGNYSNSFVPPGQSLDLCLLFFNEDENGLENGTIHEISSNITTTVGQTTSVATLHYQSGKKVSGYVKKVKGGSGVFAAQVMLYKQPNDQFIAFAETDYTGKFILNDISAGTYRMAVIYYGHDTTWTNNFDVTSQDITLSDAYLDSQADLSKTGQKTCYDSIGNVIDCSGTGQDGDKQVGVTWPSSRFVDNGDGTISDKLTGLMWFKDAGCLGQNTWQGALSKVSDLNANPGNYSCSSYSANHSDWRLPNVNEIFSLHNAEESSQSNWLASQGFTNIQDAPYWTSTTIAANSNYACFMNFGNSSLDGSKSSSYYVWAVRSGSFDHTINLPKTGQTTSYASNDDGAIKAGVSWPSPRFSDNGDGTVTDNLTGLMWLKDANFSGEITWQSALDKVADLNRSPSNYTCGNYSKTYSDWRLPNSIELLMLVDRSRYNNCLPGGNPFQNIQASNYWSSTTIMSAKGNARCINMANGLPNYNEKSTNRYLWPVRTASDKGSGSPIFDFGFQVTQRTITVDGNPSDWDGINSAATDRQGDSKGEEGTDLYRFYVAKDDQYLYYRIDTYSNNFFSGNNQNAGPTIGIRKNFSNEIGMMEARVIIKSNNHRIWKKNESGWTEKEFNTDTAKYNTVAEGKIDLTYFDNDTYKIFFFYYKDLNEDGSFDEYPNSLSGSYDFNGNGKSDILWRNTSTGQVNMWMMNGLIKESELSVGGIDDLNWEINNTGDFNGNGKTDILWRNKNTGQVNIWLMNGGVKDTEGSPGTVGDLNWIIKGVGDFDGDGKSDILWRNKNSGQVYLWLMNGTAITSEGSPGTVEDLNWEIIDTGDFNGDRRFDILWRNNTTGQVYIWLMNGLDRDSFGSLGAVENLNWEIKNTGYFNDDKKVDILWKNKNTGEIYIWMMNGLNIESEGFVGKVDNLRWEIKNVGDYNGDGKSDILWRNKTTGMVYIWFMNGFNSYSDGSPGKVDDLNWEISSKQTDKADIVKKIISDFNGNGKSDILWRNKTTGQVYIWLMNGMFKDSQDSPGTAEDLNWETKGIGDFNGNGKADVFWRNKTTGQTYMWLMNGTNRDSEGSPGSIEDLNWEINGVGDFNGNGKADILWRNKNSGQVNIWFMNGLNQDSVDSPGTVENSYWEIKGVGDFDGDGKSDILWRNKNSGQVYIWLMNGATKELDGSPGTVNDLNWDIIDTGDFNSDGKSDILWRNKTSGMVYIWIMNGVSINSKDSPGTVDNLNWEIINAEDFDGNGKSDILWRNTTTGQIYMWMMNGIYRESEGIVDTVNNLDWEIKKINERSS